MKHFGFFKFYIGGVLVPLDTRVVYTWTPEGPEIEEVRICIELDFYELEDWSEAKQAISDSIRRERARHAA